MRHSVIIASIAVAISWSAFCQSTMAPVFDVASVKVNPDDRGREQIEVSPLSLMLKKANLNFCIHWAYNVRLDQISGPSWLRSERYDIMAKAAVSSTEAQMRLMLQKLLAERFKLVFHRETKVLPIYEMVVAKGGSKLVESKADNASPKTNRGSYEIPHTSLTEFAGILQSLGAVSLPVVDRTGLDGRFDITLKFPEGMRPSDTPPPDMSDASIFSIMERQLGLKLELRKAPTETLVIDYVQKMPTEN